MPRFCCFALSSITAVLVSLLALSTSSMAQEQLLHESWRRVETEHFTLLSQSSARHTLAFADELETWRQIAAHIIQGAPEFGAAAYPELPKAAVPNYVYLFADQDSFEQFTLNQEPAFFYPSPRANFMALVARDEKSVSAARHHYVHFLIQNFSDIRLPRWYEEGLASYLGRMQINRGKPRFERFTEEANSVLASVIDRLPMDRLLYLDSALASPLLIQIANLKSESLLHYIMHAYEEDGMTDRRRNLDEYLQLLLSDRNPRFAFDQAFDITTAQLDAELLNYLASSKRPAGRINFGEPKENPDYTQTELSFEALAISLGELALNAGQLENAQLFFQAVIDSGSNHPRGYSGLGDALRFQELDNSDQTIAKYFQQALELGENNINIVLDYGEYWESELSDCSKNYPPVQRRLIVADIEEKFRRALSLDADNPEVNLAMGQLYLLEGQDWRQGLEFQRKAFASLSADTFIMEQSVKYAVAGEDFDEAERLITEMAQPIHMWGEPGYVTDLRERLMRKRRGESYDVCADE